MRLFPLLYVLGKINAHHEAGHVDKTVFIKATDQQMQEAKRSDLRDSLRKRKKKGQFCHRLTFVLLFINSQVIIINKYL